MTMLTNGIAATPRGAKVGSKFYLVTARAEI
jgi:hypothetical protein